MSVMETKSFQQVEPLLSFKARKGLEISERRDPGASAMSGIPPAPGGTGKAHLLSSCAHRDLRADTALAFPEWESWELYPDFWGCPEE